MNEQVIDDKEEIDIGEYMTTTKKNLKEKRKG